MSGGCKDKCAAFMYHGRPKYAPGVVYCAACEIYMEFRGTYCPCCKYQLRTSPLDKNAKKKTRWKDRG